jgi:hypothetical protein
MLEQHDGSPVHAPEGEHDEAREGVARARDGLWSVWFESSRSTGAMSH